MQRAMGVFSAPETIFRPLNEWASLSTSRKCAAPPGAVYNRANILMAEPKTCWPISTTKKK
ncbi:hypothetical protein BN130_1902 [Cronobacter malonaticus 507]|nr:hypothetical protein BN130_1902 [Cronobacter malonaticus 507]